MKKSVSKGFIFDGKKRIAGANTTGVRGIQVEFLISSCLTSVPDLKKSLGERNLEVFMDHQSD